MFVIWYVSDKRMMIHLNSCTYRDCGDVSYTDFIRREDSKTLTYVRACVRVCMRVSARACTYFTNKILKVDIYTHI